MTNDNNSHDILNLIRTEFRALPVRELLHKPPRVLLGVTPLAETVLASLEIASVFDLATSGIFNDALKLVNAGADLRSALYQHGAPSADLVREAETVGKQIAELQFLNITVLERVPSDLAATIETTLDVQTIRDLALYPPFRAAVKLMNAVYQPENVAGYDPERPADLLPKSGEYATERVQYSTLLLDEIPVEDGVSIVDVAGKTFKPIDLSLLDRSDAGFKKTAFGALLTFNQSWFAQGVTLGQLLHSISLAPGESTRIAVIDWSRKSRAGETEIIDETDDLTNDQSQNRSISEVTRAVADEAQGGFSGTTTNSVSMQSGLSLAKEIYWVFGGGSMGTTNSSAVDTAQADSYSNSWGHRDLGSTMTQNVNDRTHQHAHSNRSRRASVIKEVSQSEHEGVSTRVIANYNHMHALTVQYYEVVQVYRVEVAIVKADRVVFIPFQMVDFSQDNTIRRFQNVLARAALTYGVREALKTLETIEVAPDTLTLLTVLGGTLGQHSLTLDTGKILAVLAKPPAAAPKTDVKVVESAAILPALGTFSQAGVMSAVQQISAVQHMNAQIWSVQQPSRLAGLLNLNVLRSSSNSLFLPADVLVEGASVTAEGAPVKVIFRDLTGKELSSVSSETPVALSNIGRITLGGSNPNKAVNAEVVLTLNRNGVRFPVELPSVQIPKAATVETRLVQVKAGGADVNLKKHLMDNRMYYSQVVFRSLDPTQTAALLSGFGVQVNGKVVPVAQVVEPRAIRLVGNYLAFKMNSDVTNDLPWRQWLTDHGIHLGVPKEDVIPLATGGTFAEAVLGRSNSAEKLDITRFWNWQDSPIPLQPTEIAAVQTGSRATNEEVKPGQLSNPIVNITSPTSLPDPMGTAAILAAIQNGNMFRDMSGLQSTIGLAQAALQATAAGAATAGQEAGTNMNNLLKANTERQRIAAEMISSILKTAAGALTGGAIGGGSGISGGGNHSQDGAKINYFDKTKGQAPAAAKSNGSGGAVAPVAGGGKSSGGGVSGSSNGASASSGGVTENSVGGETAGWSQNPGILAATWGDGASNSSLVEKAMDLGFADEPVGLTDEGIDVVSGADPVAPPPVDLFPATVADPMAANAKMQTALLTAIGAAETKFGLNRMSFPIPMTIVDITEPDGLFPVAAYLEDEEDFIASEAKVGVMYSAYALRDMVRRFAQELNIATTKELFAQLPRMNRAILNAVPALANVSGITDKHRLPTYGTTFTATPSSGGLDIQFTSSFNNALEKMIVPSSNESAARSVHGVGYSYLNGALSAGEFFDQVTQKGVWVAGDFQGATVWPPARIVPTTNDGLSAQASTTRAMARLVALIATRRALDTASCDEMLGRMHRAELGADSSYMGRRKVFKPGVVTNVKIGQGWLSKPGRPKVDSEVAVLTGPVASERKYVVAWQNALHASPIDWKDIGMIVLQTITAYESP